MEKQQYAADTDSATESRAADLTVKPKFIRTITLFMAVALNFGQIVGAGIFVSPKGVLMFTGSSGLSLIVWTLCGLVAMASAVCYAELATMLKESGGEWAYIRRGIGGGPAFVASLLTVTLGSGAFALVAIISAEYMVSPFLDDCSKPPYLVKMLAIALMILIFYINTSTNLVQKIVKVTLVVKVITMLAIVLGAFYWMAKEGTSKLTQPFQGTTTNGWNVAVAFYSGLFAYMGWDNVTNLTEEVKNYKRNIPLSIIISVSMVTALYVLINISYYAVIGPDRVLSSNVVVLEWGRALFGEWGVLLSFFVSLSALGAGFSGLYGMTRQMCCVAREGHTIQLLAMVDVKESIPVIAMVNQTILAIIFCLVGEGIVAMLNFLSFVGGFVKVMAMFSLVKLKLQKHNDNEERFRVPLILPILMTLVYVYLAVVPIINNPNWYHLYGILLAVIFFVIYIVFIKFNSRVSCFDRVTLFVQRLMGVAVIDKFM
ncbi:b(0,+)-type amino acid transporter 1-like [Watersipora subatra]|uniref:b(0,+)-type amino acid transporter 1-like n=1 Tax=Watersipora subatra TaxID=2589382 RepID=UPI00355BEBC7